MRFFKTAIAFAIAVLKLFLFGYFLFIAVSFLL